IGASEHADRDQVPRLVNLLEDDDPAVRMYAILSLRRLTGQDFGYHYYDSDAERAVAVARWRGALRRGELYRRDSAAESATAEQRAASTERPHAEGGHRQ